jgi:hypothetical protein
MDNIFAKLFRTQLPIEVTKLSQKAPYIVRQEPSEHNSKQPFNKDVVVMNF